MLSYSQDKKDLDFRSLLMMIGLFGGELMFFGIVIVNKARGIGHWYEFILTDILGFEDSDSKWVLLMGALFFILGMSGFILLR